MNWKTASLIVLLFSSTINAAPLKPEQTHSISLSNRDVNRIVCQNGSINDVYYSQEKAIQVTNAGDNAFVKFLVKDNGVDKEYVRTKSEFYVVCNGDVYTLIASPKNISARTIYLGNPVKNKMETNIELFAPLTIEEQTVFLTNKVFTGDIPDSFNVKKVTGIWKNYGNGLKVRPIRKYSVEGVGLNLIEYQIAAYTSQQLRETDFLSSTLSPNIIGVTIHPLKINTGETSRLFLVEKEIQQ